MSVNVSIALLKVVSMEEEHHAIKLQFKITLEWRDNRVTFNNLKKKTSLNALVKKDYDKLWLPLVTYVNTDDKETTRLPVPHVLIVVAAPVSTVGVMVVVTVSL